MPTLPMPPNSFYFGLHYPAPYETFAEREFEQQAISWAKKLSFLPAARFVIEHADLTAYLIRIETQQSAEYPRVAFFQIVSHFPDDETAVLYLMKFAGDPCSSLKVLSRSRHARALKVS